MSEPSANEVLERIAANVGGGSISGPRKQIDILEEIAENTEDLGDPAPAYDDTALKQRVGAVENEVDGAVTALDLLDNRVDLVEADIATLKNSAGSSGSVVMMEYVSIWGDSRTAQNWNSAGNAATARGYAWWMETLSGRIRLSIKYNFGVSGDSIQQLLDRMTNDVANAAGVKPSQVPPSHAVLYIGTNSINAETALSSCMFQLNKCIDWLLSHGHTVYVVCEWPRGQTINGVQKSILTANAQKIMLGYAREIRKLTRAKKIKVIDCWPLMADPASTTAQPRAGYLNNDSLHPSIGGGFLTGKLLADAIRENNGHRISFPPGTQDLYDATSNKEGSLTPNPMLRGTGGTMGAVSGTPTPAAPTGFAPDGWSISSTAGLTYATSAVQSIAPDGQKKDAIRFVISGKPEAVMGSVMLRIPAKTRVDATGPWLNKVADGDVLEAWGEIAVLGSHTNFGNVTCNIAANTAALSQSGGIVTGGTGTPDLDTFTGDIQWPANLKQDYAGVVRSPELTVAAAHTQFQIEVRAYFLQAGLDSTVTFDVFTAGCRKKTLPV